MNVNKKKNKSQKKSASCSETFDKTSRNDSHQGTLTRSGQSQETWL